MYKVTKQLRETVAASGLYIPGNMLAINSDSKTVKGLKKGYLTGVMYLKPTTKTCPSSVAAGCIDPCLDTAGRGVFDNVAQGRINKRELVEQYEEIALIALWKSINGLINKAKKKNLIPVVRLNGTSDIDWTTKKLDGKTLFEHFPDTQFYDYTKVPSIVRKAKAFDNYHITASYSGTEAFKPILNKLYNDGANIAVVFRGGLPETYMGLPVINGDETDLRFLDDVDNDCQKVVGLTAKGKAKKSDSAFIVDTNIIARG